MSDMFQELPKEGTKRWKICMYFLKDYPLTPEQFIEAYGMMNCPFISNLRCELDDLVREGLLKEFKGSYSPSARLKNGIKVEGVDYVKPREPKPFTPMSPKHYLPRVSPRGQQLREFCHIGLANGAKEEEGRNDLSVLNEVMSGLQAN
jgi:hypothetical protein